MDCLYCKSRWVRGSAQQPRLLNCVPLKSNKNISQVFPAAWAPAVLTRVLWTCGNSLYWTSRCCVWVLLRKPMKTLLAFPDGQIHGITGFGRYDLTQNLVWEEQPVLPGEICPTLTSLAVFVVAALNDAWCGFGDVVYRRAGFVSGAGFPLLFTDMRFWDNSRIIDRIHI